MKHIISIGGGIASTLLLPIHVVYEQHVQRGDIDLIMARLPNEDPDVWKLVELLEDRLNVSVKMIGSNQDPWQVFFDRQFIGNSRVDPCSDELKRKVVRQYIRENYSPGEAIIYVGIGAYELDREMTIRKRWGEQGYKVSMPLIEYPELNRSAQMRFCQSFAGFVPRLYQLGFSHNNCGGACVKAGQKEWARLLWFLPDVYQWWENNEELWRSKYGDYSVLKDRRDGTTKPLPLRLFRENMLQKWNVSKPEFSNLIVGFERLEISGGLSGLDETPGCSFCDAIA